MIFQFKRLVKMKNKLVIKFFALIFCSFFLYGGVYGQDVKELVVLDEAMANKKLIIKCLKDNMELIILKEGEDQIEKLTSSIKKYKSLEAIHLLVCGKDGVIMFEDSPLQSSTIGKYMNELSEWKDSFTENGDLLIYTCNLAGSNSGRLVIRQLSAYTGLDVAASTNMTGNLGNEGDWDLEFMKGKIETASCFNENKISDFPGVLVRKGN